jgi:hypothetical protein
MYDSPSWGRSSLPRGWWIPVSPPTQRPSRIQSSDVVTVHGTIYRRKQKSKENRQMIITNSYCTTYLGVFDIQQNLVYHSHQLCNLNNNYQHSSQYSQSQETKMPLTLGKSFLRWAHASGSSPLVMRALKTVSNVWPAENATRRAYSSTYGAYTLT